MQFRLMHYGTWASDDTFGSFLVGHCLTLPACDWCFLQELHQDLTQPGHLLFHRLQRLLILGLCYWCPHLCFASVCSMASNVLTLFAYELMTCTVSLVFLYSSLSFSLSLSQQERLLYEALNMKCHEIRTTTHPCRHPHPRPHHQSHLHPPGRLY